jgi:hypothetical protein
MNGSFCSTNGNLYNTRRVVTDKDALVAAVWDAGLKDVSLPLLVESVYDSDGGNSVVFYTPGDCFADTQKKLMDGECDARISVTILPGDEVRGWHCFMWDSISNTIYFDICKYGDSTYAGYRSEELTSEVKLCAAENLGDSITFENARDNGLVPFKISYHGNFRAPRLVVMDGNGGELKIEPLSKTIRLKGRYWDKYCKRGYRHRININQNAVDCINDHIDGIVDASKEVVDVSRDVVDAYDVDF